MEEEKLLETGEVNNAQEQEEGTTLSDRLLALRQKWTSEVEALNDGMKNLAQVDHTINIIFTKRQSAVDLYHGMLGVMHKQLRVYKQQYATMYNSFKSGQQNGLRYGSDTAIATQIEAQLMNHKEVIDELKDFTDFMWETIKTIDGIQYAITSKIKIYELMNGIKF